MEGIIRVSLRQKQSRSKPSPDSMVDEREAKETYYRGKRDLPWPPDSMGDEIEGLSQDVEPDPKFPELRFLPGRESSESISEFAAGAVAEPSEAQTQPPARMKLGESAPASFLCAPESASAGCAGNAMPLSTVVERMDR